MRMCPFRRAVIVVQQRESVMENLYPAGVPEFISNNDAHGGILRISIRC